MTAALTCLVVGATVAGCTNGTTAEEPSAKQMLDDANDTMNDLKSVTIDMVNSVPDRGSFSSRVTTDLKANCVSKTTWAKGTSLEQIRIGETDYVRPNRAYIERWSGKAMSGTGDQKRWIKTPTSNAQPGDGLSDCTRPFASFGKARKGAPTKVDGTPAIPLMVTDKADKDGGTYTFYVATKGKPYILKVVFKGPEYVSTTTFSAFDKPMDVRPPAKTDVLDASAIGR
ncbi:hypothetical protein [Streptomyces sp. SA15]|uniref:hypothetical protein n=1 Tax=Streptomyces sp. SA15 TaxID=934019 RepID=UPI00211BF9DF|nr:hypothetical protein [Streptomyces sp. SA15]